ncbi:MAG: HD-GYP domain-containing protein [Phycisphaeraceae bacterium]|nr:HD-GYP domain-containing protein [Phycisphaeraceae bacterium]
MMIGPELFVSEYFESTCRAAGLDASDTRRAMEPLACFPERGVDRVATALGWMRDDLSQTTRDRAALGEHGVQLTEMYEEIGLLYRLGRSMSGLKAPEAFVKTTCAELAATMPFGWIAVKFIDDSKVAPRLRGLLTLDGALPCPITEFDRQVTELVGGMQPDRWTLLPASDGALLSVMVGSQVLAHPIAREGRVIGAILAGNKGGEDPEISNYETQLLDAAADYMGVFVENAGLYAEQHQMFIGTLEALTASIDAKDSYTCGHSERVAYLAQRLAIAAGLSEAEAERVRISGLLHDVGKIGVPESVLCKPGRLTDDEFELIKLHPTIGHRILRDIPTLDDVLPGVLYHHERWDGRGYPAGIQAEQIPLVARLLAVADSFDAMSSNRSYRSAMPRERVLGEISKGAGLQFDPALVPLFLSLDLAVYDEMVAKHRSQTVVMPREAA